MKAIYSALFILTLGGCTAGQSGFSGQGSPPETPIYPPRNAKPVCLTKQNFLKSEELDSDSALAVESLINAEKTHNYVTPTEKLNTVNWPEIDDDLDFENLDLAIDRQLAHFGAHPPDGVLRLGGDQYPLSWAVNSLEQMKELAKQARDCLSQNSKKNHAACMATFSAKLKDKFNMYRPTLVATDPRYGQEKEALFTGYYTPLIHTTTTKTGLSTHPIYGRPEQKSDRTATRVDIDFNQALANRGLELYYGLDLFEFYMAHIQGNAHVIIDGDRGGSYFLNYAGTNGQRFEFISTYMTKKGLIPNDSIAAQKNYLDTHPDRQKEIYGVCPSYVFFRSTSTPPTGSSGVAVTANRSIATDSRYYGFKGLVSFITASRPEEEQEANQPCDHIRFRAFSRFFLDQDTGGAIRGKARADLFFGEGDYAQLAASNEVEKGNIYFLMLKR